MKVKLFGRASALALGLLIAGMSGQAFAQDAGAPQDDTEVEAITVTGSFLTREDSVLPVDVVNTEELSQRGAPTMVQFIKTIPSSGSVLGENNRFGGGNGTSTVNLRNLGSNRTLVLFNGRRLATSIRSGGGVDVNLLPSNAIQRVEVLKDGAAATYGSDAIGGVVNFISRTDLDGLELMGQYQFIDGSDGDYNLGAAWGWRGESGNVLLTANYRARSMLPVAERDWALRTGEAGYLQNPVGGWAGTGNPGTYNTSTVAPTGSPATGFTGTSFQSNTGNLLDIGCVANGGAAHTVGSIVVSNTACAFQYTTFDNLVEDEKNLQLYGQLNFDLTDNVKFHGEVMYSTNDTPAQSWAITGPNQWPTSMLSSGVAAPGGGVSPIPVVPGSLNEQSRFYIPATNPGLIAMANQINAANCTGSVLPYGVDLATCNTALTAAKAQTANALLYGVAPSQTGWRPVGFGGDPASADKRGSYSYKTESLRFEGGFKGTFANGIGWDASANYHKIDYAATLSDISVNRLQLALAGFGSREGDANACTSAETTNFTANAGNAALGCYYFNPFTNAFATSLSGDKDNPYYIGSSGIAGFNDAATNRAAVFDWMEIDQPNHNTVEQFVGDLIFNGDSGWKLWGEDTIAWAAGGQYRYDRTVDNPDPIYDSFATPCVDSPPFGDGAPACPGTGNGPFLFNANRKPYDVERKIYAGFGEARFPILDNLEATLAIRYENYKGLGSTTNPKLSARWQALDWLAIRGSAGTTYRAPAATQTTTGFNRGLVNANGSWRANDTFGNPNLEAEEADTFSVGVLFNRGPVTASVDYWSFDFSNPLTTESTTDMVALMFPGGSNTGNCGVAAFAALQTRFTFDQGVCSRANITSYRTNNINGGPIETTGFDFQLNVDAGEYFGGAWSVGVDGTYLESFDESPYLIEGIPSNAAGIQKRAGTFRASNFLAYNRLRSNAFVNFSMGDHNFRWQTRYVSGTRQTDATPLALATALNTTADIDSYFQHDLTWRWDVQETVQATFTIQNVFDKDPPFALGTQYNYDPGSLNPLGRVYSVTVKKAF